MLAVLIMYAVILDGAHLEVYGTLALYLGGFHHPEESVEDVSTNHRGGEELAAQSGTMLASSLLHIHLDYQNLKSKKNELKLELLR